MYPLSNMYLQLSNMYLYHNILKLYQNMSILSPRVQIRSKLVFINHMKSNCFSQKKLHRRSLTVPVSVKAKPKASFFAVLLELYQLFFKEPALLKKLSKMYRRTNDLTAVNCAKLKDLI